MILLTVAEILRHLEDKEAVTKAVTSPNFFLTCDNGGKAHPSKEKEVSHHQEEARMCGGRRT